MSLVQWTFIEKVCQGMLENRLLENFILVFKKLFSNFKITKIIINVAVLSLKLYYQLSTRKLLVLLQPIWSHCLVGMDETV